MEAMSKPASETPYVTLNSEHGVPIKAWVRGVPFEPEAEAQLRNLAQLPFVHKWVAAMPDVHLGKGSTVGSVIATQGAVIPAAVGVDIGCGMIALGTTLTARDLPETLAHVRSAIEAAVPHGRTDHGGRNDRGAWGNVPARVEAAWAELEPGYRAIVTETPRLGRGSEQKQLGTLGTGNHFIEICLDERDQVWFMLHSGSRGVGNRIGTHFIEIAKREMKRWFLNVPDQDLAYLAEGSAHFDAYWKAVSWAQQYAKKNRELMMQAVIAAVQKEKGIPPFSAISSAVNCHHNYVAREQHYGAEVLVTRKGAVRAGEGELGIIPGSMGARSFIVRGRGNPESFCSCSHGAGRKLSRTAARKAFTLEDHERATAGIECRKDESVIDETPGAYKSIEDVMKAQADLVEVVHTLRQIVCVKG